VPRVWVGRSFGRQKREHFSGGEVDYLFLLFVLSWQIVESFFVKGNSYPAQCNAEGGGSPMFVVEGGASTDLLC